MVHLRPPGHRTRAGTSQASVFPAGRRSPRARQVSGTDGGARSTSLKEELKAGGGILQTVWAQIPWPLAPRSPRREELGLAAGPAFPVQPLSTDPRVPPGCCRTPIAQPTPSLPWAPGTRDASCSGTCTQTAPRTLEANSPRADPPETRTATQTQAPRAPALTLVLASQAPAGPGSQGKAGVAWEHIVGRRDILPFRRSPGTHLPSGHLCPCPQRIAHSQ